METESLNSRITTDDIRDISQARKDETNHDLVASHQAKDRFINNVSDIQSSVESMSGSLDKIKNLIAEIQLDRPNSSPSLEKSHENIDSLDGKNHDPKEGVR